MLHIATRGPTALKPSVGDVVCYLDERRKFVAHRVTGVRGESDARRLMVAGDGSGQPDEIDETAIVGIVTRVEHPLFSYDTRGAVGWTLSRWALRRSLSFRGALVAAELTAQLYGTASRFVGRGGASR
jgi:hypothetical protein